MEYVCTLTYTPKGQPRQGHVNDAVVGAEASTGGILHRCLHHLREQQHGDPHSSGLPAFSKQPAEFWSLPRIHQRTRRAPAASPYDSPTQCSSPAPPQSGWARWGRRSPPPSGRRLPLHPPALWALEDTHMENFTISLSVKFEFRQT